MQPLLVEQFAVAAEGAAKTQSSLRDAATPLPDAAALVTSFNSTEPEADFVSPKALGQCITDCMEGVRLCQVTFLKASRCHVLYSIG